MKKKDEPITHVRQWLKLFEDSVLYRHEPSRMFEDYLDLTLCALANQKQEERYLKVAGRYKREELEVISQLFAYHILIHEHQTQDGGWYDMLGDVYMDMAGRSKTSRMGQFFTPAAICDMMTRITVEDPAEAEGKSCLDPCVGSGRMLLAAHAVQPKWRLVAGADLDPICAKMCALNFWLHGVRGEVAHMNTLSQEWYFAWQTHPNPGWPFVTFLDESRKEESVLYVERKQLLERAQQRTVPPAPDLFSSEVHEPEPSWNKPPYFPKTTREYRDRVQRANPEVVILFRQEFNYEVFGVDAKILSANFNLELRRTEELLPVVVFPDTLLHDVLPWLIRAGEPVEVNDPNAQDAPWVDSAVHEQSEAYGDPPLRKTHRILITGTRTPVDVHLSGGQFYGLDGTWNISIYDRSIRVIIRYRDQPQAA